MSLVEPEAVNVEARVSEIASPDFWRRNFPALHISDRLQKWNQAGLPMTDESRNLYFARMMEEGYFQDQSEACDRIAPLLAEAVTICKRLDIPPAFLFLFDEPWEMFYSLHPMISSFLGPNYKVLPDFWTWHVDPQAGEAGWRPHRDKGRATLAPNGVPTTLTIWIPLTEATPQNGCMYILPANRDPVYNTPNEKNWQVDMAAIRALPGKPGDFFCWNQAVLHWGSMTSRFAKGPRMSMALEFQRADIPAWNTPLMDPFTNHTFEDRLKLVGKQILQYKHMYPLAPRFQQLAEKLVSA
ncbi:MAG: phytanoyl-CoA dioxygenase family protein [Caulobacteraceae bacterium]